ncbi:MAG: ion channel [Sulfurovum sp.]
MIKGFCRALLDDVESPYKRYFDSFMIVLIILSTTLLVVDKSETIPYWLYNFDLYFVTYLFAVEYLLRLWIYDDGLLHYTLIDKIKNKLKYIFSPPAIIDFIAIFPQFRIIRLLKLYRYMRGASSLFEALVKKRFEFIFLGYMLLGVTFTFGSIFYLLEFGINKNINSYFDAIYWTFITISTVGYGDIVPATQMGKMVSVLSIIVGVGMISFVTSMMVSAFSERFNELRNQDSINYLYKMKNIIIINGYGHLAQTIIKKLSIKKIYTPIIIENDKEKAQIAIQNGYRVITADGSSARIIKIVYKKRNNIIAMLTLSNSDIDNIYFILNAKSIYSQSKVYTRINQLALKPQYIGTKVDGLVEPYNIVNKKAFDYLKRHAIEEEKSIFFFGYTHKSSQICAKLRDEYIDITIYEIDTVRYKQALEDGFSNIVLIDDDFNKSEIDDYSIAVCAMNEEALNVYYAITLRTNGFVNEIVALSDSKEDNRKLILAGVSKIFDMYEESALQFVEMIEKCPKS